MNYMKKMANMYCIYVYYLCIIFVLNSNIYLKIQCLLIIVAFLISSNIIFLGVYWDLIEVSSVSFYFL